MRVLRKLAIGAASVVAVFVVVGLLLPHTAHVERSIVVQAPPATVFTVLNGFRQFGKWSPWADQDPEMTTSFDGPATGVGAKLSWSGRHDQGSQEIVESRPFEYVKLRLAFGDFPGDFLASYALAPEGAGTRVTWSFDADYGGSLMGRWFGLFADAMVGPDFVKGLAKLKAFIEASPRGDFSKLDIESVETQESTIVFLPIHSADEPRAISLGVGVAYSRLSGYLASQKMKAAGPPLAIFRSRDGNTLQIDAALPVGELAAALAHEVQRGRLPGGHAVKATYRGSYMGLPAAREQVLAYLSTAGLERAGPSWERYVSDALTELYYPIK